MSKKNFIKTLSILINLWVLSACTPWHANRPFPEEKNLAPIPAQAHFFQGIHEVYQQNWRQAAIHFDKAASLDPKAARIHMHLGKCLIKLRRYRKGIKELKMAEKLTDSKDYLMWFEIGEGYHWAGLVLQAQKFYQKAVTIYPRFQRGNKALATLQRNL